MTESQLHQAVSAASNFHAMICQRMIHAVGVRDDNDDVDPWIDREEFLAMLAATRLLNKTFCDAYHAKVDKS